MKKIVVALLLGLFAFGTLSSIGCGDDKTSKPAASGSGGGGGGTTPTKK